MSQPFRSLIDLDPETPARVLHSGPDGEALTVSQVAVKVRTSELRPADSPRLDGLDPDHVRTLAAIDEPFPPIIVHRPTMRVIDGMHRLEAARINGRYEIDVCFFMGDLVDVFRLAVRANVAHGLPLTLADRKAAAERILQARPQLSDRSIAYTTGLAAKTVARIRRLRRGGESGTRIGQDGKARPLSTADGRRIASRAIAARPGASLREIAQEAGISVGTVRDVRARLESGKNPVPSPRRGRRGHVSPDAVSGKVADQGASQVDVDAVLESLRRDPALRYTESGRTLLRCLGTHVMTLAQVQEAIDGVPPHCTILIAKVARGCAGMWSTLAAELSQRA